MYFPGFAQDRVSIEKIAFNVRRGGSGHAVLLLHGFPQTHLCWRLIAPDLARSFAVVCPDLKGYGDSDAPAPTPDSKNYSKRAMAEELVALMARLGYDRFDVIGHDRGARIGYRLALDHPECVRRLVILDILPTCEQWDVADRHFAVRTYHWGFLAREGGLPERLVGLDPDFYLDYTIRSWAGSMASFTPDVLAEYRRCFRRPATIAAACADYRAGYGIDDALDRADRQSGRRIACPVQVLWGEEYMVAANPVLDTWRQWADRVEGRSIRSGHFLPEEAPEAVLETALPFLRKS
jgi:haloacetate dehalogenase